jgi:hypothetical protein
MWPLAMAGGDGRPNYGEVPPRLGREIVGGGARAHLGLICAGVGGREAASGGGRRQPPRELFLQRAPAGEKRMGGVGSSLVV